MSASKKERQIEQPAGSPSPGEPVFLVVGKIRRPHGVKGEMIMEIITDFPERLNPGLEVFLGEQYLPKKIRSCRLNGETLLLTFDGIDTPESAGELRNKYVYVPAKDSPELEDGEYYHHQILGLDVITDDGKKLGKVSDILITGANEVYIVQGLDGKEILLPAIEPVVLNINLAEHVLLVHLLPGLLAE